ncbi:MAG: FAD-dependent oxidoreductase [Gammaproteobacteria bacterium]|nr:FAD-dependent oxidoreductase [Gammaproteobacteria bacterium]MYF29353.1 FAD-dependent oxidoreductase [Gammaproteobacteria bacterium]MYK47399.1 FAD-dependent oxidoreductase [Gammaproteobacteria bacterium]
MRVAVVGAGISGIAAAHYAQEFADVTLYEADRVLGGHTDTHNLFADDRSCAVDSGFIVFNTGYYPLFSRWLDELGVASKPTDMSFGVSLADGVEYGTSNLKALFCQHRNILRPDFLAMLRDIPRFYRRAGQLVDDDRTLAELCAEERYSSAFVNGHLMPMCAALWSASRSLASAMPVAHVAAFMANHGLLQLRHRPAWRVVDGGSNTYLAAFESRFRGQVRKSCPVRHVLRDADGVTLQTDTDARGFDQVVLACHADDALRIVDPTSREHSVLGAFGYQTNRAVIHSDASVMPANRGAWSSWNVHATRENEFEFTYWMNRLQGIHSTRQFFVTLNPARPLNAVWLERDYRHPVFDSAARTAQGRRDEVNAQCTLYCGAYWGWGFHEDGFRSGYEAAQRLREICLGELCFGFETRAT